MPLWQFEKDPFEAVLSESPTPPSPIAMKFNIGDLTALECDLENSDDADALVALSDQIHEAEDLLGLVNEEVRLTKERLAQIKNRWECKGYLSLKLAKQFPRQFVKPATWDVDVENLISRSMCSHPV
jgi:hypothetical protein